MSEVTLCAKSSQSSRAYLERHLAHMEAPTPWDPAAGLQGLLDFKIAPFFGGGGADLT